MHANPFAADRFLIEQLIRPVANLYTVSTLAADGKSAGEPVAFARQKKLAIKEDLRIYRDESEAEELFRIKARRMMEIGGRYDVADPAGVRIGVLEKRFKESLLRSTWRILDGSEAEIAWARERSLPIALARRVVDLVPYGDFIPIPYHFTVLRGEREVGEVTRPIGIRDRYVLDLSREPERVIDRRLAVAMAIAFDALQSR